MYGKTNPWIISTVLLVGIIVGFGAAKLPIGGGGAVAVIPAQQPSAPTRKGTLPTGDIQIREVTKDDHIRGAKNPKVIVVEYSDFECPFCKRFHPTMQKLIDTYPNDVSWVYRQFPLDSLHRKARKEAEATECAAAQGKFWEMADKIFEVTPSNDGLDLDSLPTLAADIGLNVNDFQKCLDDGTFANHVQDDIDDATRAGGRGTPYSVVITEDGQKIPVSGAQPFSVLETIVKSSL